jgi:hypothetical protein
MLNSLANFFHERQTINISLRSVLFDADDFFRYFEAKRAEVSKLPFGDVRVDMICCKKIMRGEVS